MDKVTTFSDELRSAKNTRDELKVSPDTQEMVVIHELDFNIMLEEAEGVSDNQRCHLSAESWRQLNHMLSESAAPTLALQEIVQRNNTEK